MAVERNWGIPFLVVVGRALAKAQAARGRTGGNEMRRGGGRRSAQAEREREAQTTRRRGGGRSRPSNEEANHRLRLGVERVTGRGAGGWERTTDRGEGGTGGGPRAPAAAFLAFACVPRLVCCTVTVSW